MLARYQERNLTWIDLVAPTPAEVKALMSEFDLDPKLGHELLSPTPKSKAERYDNTLYLVLHFPVLRALHPRPQQELDFIVGKNFLITVRYENIDPLHMFAKAFEANAVLLHKHTEHGGHLFVEMSRNLYRSLATECDTLHNRLDDIEEGIFRGKERAMVARISEVGRMLHDFRRALAPHQEMLQSLEPVGERLFGAGFGYHVRSLVAEEARVRRTLEHLREWLGELRDTNDSLLEVKQNETMTNLTIMALMTFPLSLFAALFTIEAKSRPIIGATGDFWIIVGMMLAIAGTLLLYFKHRHWI